MIKNTQREREREREREKIKMREKKGKRGKERLLNLLQLIFNEPDMCLRMHAKITNKMLTQKTNEAECPILPRKLPIAIYIFQSKIKEHNF